MGFQWVCGAMVARLTSIVIRYQKVAVSSTVTLIIFAGLVSILEVVETRRGTQHVCRLIGQQYRRWSALPQL